jgi:hypothetical protein
MRKLILAGLMTLALPAAAFAQTAGTTDTTSPAPAATTTKHTATHHRAAHHKAKHTKHARTHKATPSSTTPSTSSAPVN